MRFQRQKGWECIKLRDDVVPGGCGIRKEAIAISISAASKITEYIGEVYQNIPVGSSLSRRYCGVLLLTIL